MATHLTIDHLVWATPDLAAAVVDVETRFGVAPVPGGAHVGFGTFNALLGLGGHTYLEIIGPDPAQPELDRPRPFGIDDLDRPRLVAWCAAPHRPLDDVVADSRAAGFEPGPIGTMSRRRPDGTLLEWSLTMPDLGAEWDGILPFLIDWGRSPHPTRDLPIGGSLVGLELAHPQPRLVDLILSAMSDERLLGDDDSRISVGYADRPALVARIGTARGVVILD